MTARPLRICIVYDRIYPLSVGGAERWYRLLAEQLVRAGHHVTYLTAHHWITPDGPVIPGVRVLCCASNRLIYHRGRRRLLPVFSFGMGVGRHLLLHGRRYDVVHGSAMSAWSALASSMLAPVRGYRSILDWWEVWTWQYWRQYLGVVSGTVGWLVQWLLANMPHQPVVYSALHAARLSHLGRGARALLFRGLLDNATALRAPRPAEINVVSIGRHVPEKQVSALPAAIALAQRQIPGLRATAFGHGPATGEVQAAIVASGMDPWIDTPGFVPESSLKHSLGRALCLVLLSRREGFGLVVAEAAAMGVPSVVLSHPDSAAGELIEEGVNGVLCHSTDPEAIAGAIIRVHAAGPDLRARTLDWFDFHAELLTIQGSLPRLLDLYGDGSPGRNSSP